MTLPALSAAEDKAFRAIEATIGAAEVQVQRVLAAALNGMRAEMAKIYGRYAVDGKLSKADMTQYNRMQNMETEILQKLNPAVVKVKRIIKKLPETAYEASFFRYAWAIDSSQGVRLKWGTVNENAVRSAVDSTFMNISLDRYGPDAIATVRTAISQGLAAGKSLDKMSRDLKKAMEIESWKALRIARTEGITAANSGQEAAYSRAMDEGIEGSIVWDATLDGRTRPTHQAMDQTKRTETGDNAGTFPGPGGARARYPGDENLPAAERINCRCRVRFEVSGYAPLLRRSRDRGIIPYQRYEDWAKGR